jgi:hypothetical protein
MRLGVVVRCRANPPSEVPALPMHADENKELE